MGEVYRATDTRLNRDVALKVSAKRSTKRFAREARVVASLNHPDVCTLHDVGPRLPRYGTSSKANTRKVRCQRTKRSTSPTESPPPSKPRTKKASSIGI